MGRVGLDVLTLPVLRLAAYGKWRGTEKALARTISAAWTTSTFAPFIQRFQLSAVPTLSEPRPIPWRRALTELIHLTSSAGDMSPR